MNENHIEIVGLIAAFLTQVYKTWITKDVSSLSLPMFLMFFSGVVMWLIYGIFINSLPIIIANTITVISSFILVYFKIKYNKN